MSKAKDIIKRIKEEEIEWVDLRFTDPKGKWQHLTMCAHVMGEDELEDGLMFDGSSIEGWKAINESDMILKPDLDSVFIDPFSATPMMIITCDIVEPSTGDLYGRDPRSTAKRAEAYVKTTGIGDTVYVGPEAEFFLFDDVRFYDGYNGNGFTKRKGCDGCGSIVANARQLFQCNKCGRKFSIEFFYYLFGCLMQVAGAAVVAKPLPKTKHFLHGG